MEPREDSLEADRSLLLGKVHFVNSENVESKFTVRKRWFQTQQMLITDSSVT